MPDENVTPIGANQTSQNDQTAINQTGDDFVLDFGEGENNVEITSPVVETDNLETEQDENEKMVKTDIDLTSDDLFGEEKKDEENVIAQQEDMKIEDEKADEGKASDDFDISLDGIEQNSQENLDVTDNSDDTKEVNKPEQENNEIVDNVAAPEKEDDVSSSEQQIPDVTGETVNEEDVDDVVEGNAKDESNENDLNPENNDTKDDLDDNSSVESNDETPVKQETTQENNAENPTLQNQSSDESNFESSLTNEATSNVSADENVSTNNQEQKSDYEIKLDENNNESIVENQVPDLNFEENVLDSDNKVDEGNQSANVSIDNNSEENTVELTQNQETSLDNFASSDSEGGDTPDIFKKLSDEELGENPVNYVNNESSVVESQESESSDSVSELNSEATVSESQITQPEIGDLLGNDTTESSVDNQGGNQVVTENLSDINNNAEPVIGNIENGTEVNPIFDEPKNQIVSDLDQVNTGSPDLVLDYNESTNQLNQDIKPETVVDMENNIPNMSENISDGQIQLNISQPIEQSISQQAQENVEVNPDNNQLLPENETVIDNQVIEQPQSNEQSMTNIDSENVVMNLDVPENNVGNQEIRSTLSLDQILDSELTNNPDYSDNSKSVPTNVPIRTGLFANKKVAGIVVGVLIFALVGFVAVLAFPQKNNERKTGDVVEEYTDDLIEEEIHNSADDEQEPLEQINDEIESNTNNVTTSIVQEFPEVEGEDFLDLDIENLEPQPYNCEGEDCDEGSDFLEGLENVTAEEILSAIEDFKTEADQYYSLGVDIQDKKLIKYAMQLTNLCDSYEAQIEDEEGVDNESFETFKSKAELVLSKIKIYAGGSENIDIFEQTKSE